MICHDRHCRNELWDGPWFDLLGQSERDFVLHRRPLTIPREPAPAHRGHTSNTTEEDTEAINAGMGNIVITTPEASKTLPIQSSK